MTEQEALLAAKENVEAAMSALDFPRGSYAADEAFDALDQALQRLEAGLRYYETEENGADDVDAPVSPQREPGAAPEQSTDPGHPQGEGEGSPGPQPNDGQQEWAYLIDPEMQRW